MASSACRFPSPENYFSGVRLDPSALPDNILCFHRSHPVHELLGHEGISEISGKYDLHDRFVLVHCLREGGAVGVETNLFELSEGDAVLIFPHQLHYYLKLPGRFCWFYITFELPSEAQGEFASLRDRPRRLDESTLDRLRAVMTCYNAGVQPDGFDLALALRDLLRSLREAPSPRSQPAASDPNADAGDSALVREVKRYIYSNLDGDLRLATIAAHIGLSESYLRARFKDHMEISLWQFILTVRATRAAHLLRATSGKISEIGAACGFDSQHTFTRAFKRAFGVTPRQYRNNEA